MAEIQRYAKKCADEAPPLSPGQAAKLRRLLAPLAKTLQEKAGCIQTEKKNGRPDSHRPSECGMTAPAPFPALHTVAQVASWLGKPERWLEDEMRADRITYTRIGRDRLFTDEQIQQLLKTFEKPAKGTGPASPKKKSARARQAEKNGRPVAPGRP